MTDYSPQKFSSLMRKNGYYYSHSAKGDHKIYCNEEGVKIVVPYNLKPIIARKLIKQYHLEV